MAKRPCLEPGCPTLVEPGARGGRCTTHRRSANRARGTKAERGYDQHHVTTAAGWRARVAAGETVTCWRCGEPITDPADLHLGHDDHDRTITRGPEHGRRCNLSAAGRASRGPKGGR